MLVFKPGKPKRNKNTKTTQEIGDGRWIKVKWQDHFRQGDTITNAEEYRKNSD